MKNNQNTLIGIDSQCLSYLIDSMNGVSEPTDKLAYERKALLRIYLYLPGTLYVTPTVLTECAAIRNASRRDLHTSFCNVLFDEVLITDENQVNMMAASYGVHHSGVNDCKILAEAVHGQLQVLATYDGDFISHLNSKVGGIKLDSPSAIWESMNIPRGSSPDKRPHHTNPLSSEDWWEC